MVEIAELKKAETILSKAVIEGKHFQTLQDILMKLRGLIYTYEREEKECNG